MDVKKFSGESFDPIDWINKSLASSTEGSSKENQASNLVLKLQLFIQEINSSLEETAHQVIHNLPQVLKETESLEDEVALLRQQLKDIPSQLKESGSDPDHCIEKLKELEVMVHRMKSCSAKAESSDASPRHDRNTKTSFLQDDAASDSCNDG
jgi:uncharacterized protein (UPF0335 family)